MYTFPFLIISLILASTPASIAAFKKKPPVSYFQYCNDVVRESTPTPTPLTDPVVLTMSRSTFTFSSGEAKTLPSRDDTDYRFFLTPDTVYKTQEDGVYKFHAWILYNWNHSNIFHRQADFFLDGLWNSTSGKLCMVGFGNERKPRSQFGVLKLNYPNKSSIFNSFVNGTFRIYNRDGQFVQTLNILGVNSRNYESLLIHKRIAEHVFERFDNLSENSLGLRWTDELNLFILKSGFFSLQYQDDCSNVNCDIFQNQRGEFVLPEQLFFIPLHWWDNGFVRFLLDFSGNGVMSGIEPNSTIVAEGMWRWDKKRLDMVGCRILDGDGTVGDCTILLSLRLPMLHSIREWEFIVGEIWSSKKQNEAGYFGRVEFSVCVNREVRHVGAKYAYTVIDNVKRSFAGKMINGGKGGRFPGATSLDLRFAMNVRNKKGQVVSGYCSPLFLGGMVFEEMESEGPVLFNQSRLVNVSYELILPPLVELYNISGQHRIRFTKISAEGIYDSKTGHLYMIGCRPFPVSFRPFVRYSLDCEVVVEIQYASLDAKDGSTATGTIKSTRMASDPLYFESIQISSEFPYTGQIKQSLWRIDLEILMTLVSTTLACIFVTLQLLYVQKNPEMLPNISVIMLAVLNLAHLIPLLLNFDALFSSERQVQNLFLSSGNFLEVNEVLIRVISMFLFLLEFRVLQLAWSARAMDDNQKIQWSTDIKVMCSCLVLYVGCSLIAWRAHFSSKYILKTAVEQPKSSSRAGFQSYAGFIRDGFLLPQILFNLFYNSKAATALVPSFYVGTTLVRLSPHAYDIFRGSKFSVHKIYGNPEMDYYSSFWDTTICSIGLLFASLVYLQQQFGGRFFLPKRYRTVYQNMP